MPEIYLQKAGGLQVILETDYDKKLWDLIPEGRTIAIRPRVPRNPRFHRWSRCLISFLADNWPGGPINDDQAARWLKRKTGLVRIEKDPETGEFWIVENSTAWDSMDDHAYRHWIYEEAIPAIAILLGMDRGELEAAMDPVRAWGKCENPECGRGIGKDRHHVFGGTFARPKSEALGLIVKLCRKCHDQAEAAGVRRWEGAEISNIEYWRRIYCQVRGVDYAEAYLKIFGQAGDQSIDNRKIYRLKNGGSDGNYKSDPEAPDLADEARDRARKMEDARREKTRET